MVVGGCEGVVDIGDVLVELADRLGGAEEGCWWRDFLQRGFGSVLFGCCWNWIFG